MRETATWFARMVCLIILTCSSMAFSQDSQADIDELKKKAPRIFIDCRRCDIDYIRTEITFVNYVWDRREADIHVLITTQRTGSGGTEYTMAFIGQGEYQDYQNTLRFVSGSTDTPDEVRKGYVRVLKMGLVAAAARTPIAERIDVAFKEQVRETAVDDPWNFWVFNLGAHGFYIGQSHTSMLDVFGNGSANRVTPESKLRLALNAMWEESSFEYGEDSITSSSRSRGFSGLYVKSISDHWSAGGWLDVQYSTYSNLDLAITPSPAIEYNIFPYAESTRRQLRFLYRLNYSYVRYMEETIYDQTQENLWSHSLNASLEFNEPWGTAEVYVFGSHYFHDTSKNRIRIGGDLSIRIVKGLRLNIDGSYSRIRDQLSLRKGDASLEEVLLRRRELETDYSLFFSIGLNYSFGSVFSNVVNPRFGGGGGRHMIFF
jgi:hypothetical protein